MALGLQKMLPKCLLPFLDLFILWARLRATGLKPLIVLEANLGPQ